MGYCDTPHGNESKTTLEKHTNKLQHAIKLYALIIIEILKLRKSKFKVIIKVSKVIVSHTLDLRMIIRRIF